MWDLLITNPMLNSLLWIYSLLGNFGVAIILFTLLVRVITHPLNVQQIKGAAAMQDFQNSDKFKQLQKKYQNDKQKLQEEQMKLYKEMGINPLGSCLPTLIQFPIIIGLYQAVTRALAVTPLQLLDISRHLYPFIPASTLLPLNNRFLWMDLSQPERLNILGVGIPVLAIVVVVTSWLQSKLMTPPSQGNDSTAQTMQIMNIYMPLFMGYLALTFASGLSLYFVASNVISILQYAWMGKLNWNNVLPSFMKKRS